MGLKKTYPWNEKSNKSALWNHDLAHGQGAVDWKINSLKDNLENPNGIKFEDLLRNCCQALVMIMDHIEAKESKLKDKR